MCRGRRQIIALVYGIASVPTLTPKAEKGYRLVKNFTLARTPVVISPESNKGWRDIWKMESGGGAKATYVRYVFDGTTYIEKERKGTERIPEGIICLAGQFDYSKGGTLEPKK